MKSLKTALPSGFRKMAALYANIENLYMTFFTLLIGALIILEVIMRTAGLQGIQWLEEMGRFMLVTTTLIGCSVAVKSNGHMIMDVLYNLLGPRAAYACKAFVNLLCGCFYLYLGYYAAGWMLKLKKIGKMMESIRFPSYVMWVIVSIAVVTMGFRYLVQCKNCIVKACRGAEAFTEMNTKEM
jgi:C4-dicarboxylate transporter DctQ subunit